MEQQEEHNRPFALATGNTSKAGEYNVLLPELIGWKRSEAIQRRFAGIEDLPENCSSFTGNALVKAWHAARMLDVDALGDDAGLVVPSLQGKPGLYSKRFAKTLAARRLRLMKELHGVPLDERGAYFVCGVAYAEAGGKVLHTGSGMIRGRIALKPGKGLPDFDYSALFEVEVRPGDWKTLGEIDPSDWIMGNHRHKACTGLFRRMGWIN